MFDVEGVLVLGFLACAYVGTIGFSVGAPTLGCSGRALRSISSKYVPPHNPLGWNIMDAPTSSPLNTSTDRKTNSTTNFVGTDGA